MNLLVVSNRFHPGHEGGAERVARRIAEELAKVHRVTVLTTHAGGEIDAENRLPYSVVRVPYRNAYLHTLGPADAPVWRKLLWHVRQSLGGVSEEDLAGVIDDGKPDVVYLHNASAFLPQLARLCAARGIPLCFHAHDYALLCPKTTMYRRGTNCVKQCLDCRGLTALSRRALRRTSHAIAVSAFVRDRFKECGALGEAQWHVIANAEPDRGHQPLWRRPPRDSGPIVFGFIGMLTPTKGIQQLIEAFGELAPGTARLVVAGSGNSRFVRLLRKAAAENAVEWLGYVDTETFFADIDCLVVPSRWHEPQALVVVESVNRGVPVIASRRGGLTRFVADNRVGILFEPDGPGELAGLLANIATQTRRDWRASIPSRFPGLAQGGGATTTATRYFERIEAILQLCRAGR